MQPDRDQLQQERERLERDRDRLRRDIERLTRALEAERRNLAPVAPRLWVAVPRFQVGSLPSYLPYFGPCVRAPVYALLPVTLGVSIFALEYVRAHVRRSVSIRDIVLSGASACVMQR